MLVVILVLGFAMQNRLAMALVDWLVDRASSCRYCLWDHRNRNKRLLRNVLDLDCVFYDTSLHKVHIQQQTL